jgi:protein MPE1
VVRRRPAAGKGRGTANHYIVGTEAANALTGDHRIEAHAREAMRDKLFGRGRMHGGPMTKRFDGKEEKVVGYNRWRLS